MKKMNVPQKILAFLTGTLVGVAIIHAFHDLLSTPRVELNQQRDDDPDPDFDEDDENAPAIPYSVISIRIEQAKKEREQRDAEEQK